MSGDPLFEAGRDFVVEAAAGTILARLVEG
jgi:hypothetical protein